MSVSSVRPAQSGLGRLFGVALAAGAAAAVLNLIILFIGGAAGVPYQMTIGPGAPPQPREPIFFVLASIVPALLGAGLYALLGRFTRRGTAIFVGIAVAFSLLSLLSPLSMPVELSTRLLLSLHHLLTAAVITWGLVTYARQD